MAISMTGWLGPLSGQLGRAPGAAGAELAQALPLLRGPGAAAEGAVDGGELADVELAGVGAGGGADPEPVAAADGQVRRQVAGDGLGDAVAGGCSGGRPGAAPAAKQGRAGSGGGRASRAGRS